MAPKLYMSEASPAVRAVLMCEKALGLKLEHVAVDLLAGEQLKPEFLKLNIQHAVPVLHDDDDTIVTDSHAIMAYLIGKYGRNDTLYPRDLSKRALINQRLHFDSGNVYPIMARNTKRLLKKEADCVGEDIIEMANAAYEFLNSFLKGNFWTTGSDITIADFSLIASITSLRHLAPIPTKYVNVLTWLKRAEALPCYEVNVKGLAMYKGLMDSLLQK